MKLQTHDLNYFHRKNIFGDYGSQNMFIYQSTLNKFELKEHKGTGYVVTWKLKGIYTSKLKPLFSSFLHCIKDSR